MQKLSCHHCGTELIFDEKVFRNDTCTKCGSDVYCCLNCKQYDLFAPNECTEPVAEKVSVKDRRNFCDYFTPRVGPASSRAADKAAQSRKKLDDLFKKK
jgi:hypothetical protein